MSTWMIVRGPVAWPTAGLRRRSRETDRRSDGSERADDEADMLVEFHTQLLGTAVDVLPVDGAREALVLELFLDRARLEPRDSAPGSHEGAGGDEARELVASVEAVVEQGHPRVAREVGVGEAGVDASDSGAARQQEPRAAVHLLVKVVEHAGRAPCLEALAVASRVPPHAGLDGQRVLAEAVGL